MPSTTPSRVLCVDDDEDACEMLSLLLKAHQIDATCVRSAAQAWTLIKAERFDLYMLDGWLPNVDGFEVCRRIRQFDATTPILFYSGAAYESDKQKGVAAGANAYVTKPDFDGLLETMLDLIAKAGTDDDVSVSRADIRPAENRFSPQFLRVTAASNCSFVL